MDSTTIATTQNTTPPAFQITPDDLLALTRYWAHRWIHYEWGVFIYGRYNCSGSYLRDTIRYQSELERLRVALGSEVVEAIVDETAKRYALDHPDFDTFWNGTPEQVQSLMHTVDWALEEVDLQDTDVDAFI